MAELFGTYLGYVEEVKDPDRLGRVKVRVPHVYGFSGGPDGAIGTNDLPWALPAGMPAGGREGSGGMTWLPEQGDQVFVRFLDGEPEKPVWEWACQSSPQADTLKLHQYAPGGDPKRAGFIRYGHTLEFNSGGLVAITKRGNYATIDDGINGGIIGTNEDLTLQLGGLLTGLMAGFDFDITGASVTKVGKAWALAANDVVLSATQDVLIQGEGVLISSNTEDDGACLLDLREGEVRLAGGGAVLSFNEDGEIGLVASDGTHITLQDGGVSVVSAGGARVDVSGTDVSVSGGSVTVKAGPLTEISVGSTGVKVVAVGKIVATNGLFNMTIGAGIDFGVGPGVP